MSTILKIENRVGVRASAERIWELLADFDGWSRWNPYEVEVGGALAIGGGVALTERLPGLPDRRVTARLGDWQPYAQLLWHEKRGWQFRATRYYEIEELEPGSCIFANGIVLSGLRGEWWHDKHRKTVRPAYAEIGETMRRVAEGE